LVPMARSTFGAANSTIRTGDVIITEVYYDPADPDGPGTQRAVNFEFIELYNQTGSDVDLTGWQLTGNDAQLAFADGTTIGSGESVLLVGYDPVDNATRATTMRFLFGIPNEVQILGDAVTNRRGLGNEVGTIGLQRPGRPPADNPDLLHMVVVDELSYRNEVPWPTDTAETGNSITRVSAQEPGFAANNWSAAAASPGTVEFVPRAAVGDSNGDGVFNQLDIVAVLAGGKYLTGQPATFEEGDWNGDGRFDPLDIVAALAGGDYQTGNAAHAPASTAIDASLSKSDIDQTDQGNENAGLIADVFSTTGRNWRLI